MLWKFFRSSNMISMYDIYECIMISSNKFSISTTTRVQLKGKWTLKASRRVQNCNNSICFEMKNIFLFLQMVNVTNLALPISDNHHIKFELNSKADKDCPYQICSRAPRILLADIFVPLLIFAPYLLTSF